jgi:hypothetical protein
MTILSTLRYDEKDKKLRLGIPQRRKIKAKTAIRVITNKNHSITPNLLNKNIHDKYAMKQSIIQPIFIKPTNHLGHIKINVRQVELTLSISEKKRM